MKIIILPLDNRMSVDGRWLGVDCSGLNGIYHIEWDGAKGMIEYDNSAAKAETYRGNMAFVSFTPFQSFLNAWEAARVVADAPRSELHDFDLGPSIADLLGTTTGA